MVKRLIRKAFGKTLYHGTTLDNFKQIVSMGMISPQETTGSGIMKDLFPDYDLNGRFEGFIFLATEMRVATDYAMGENEGPMRDIGVVIEVDLPETSLLPDDTDFPEAKNWKQTEKSHSQVKILGPITTNYFRDVHFYNVNLYVKIFTAQINNWEQKFEEYKELMYADDLEDPKVQEFLQNGGGA